MNLTPRLQEELEFLTEFRELESHVFTVNKGRVSLLGKNYYPYFPHYTGGFGSSKRMMSKVNGAADITKELDGVNLIVSIPNITSKIYELRNLDTVTSQLFLNDYTVKAACRAILSDDPEKRDFFHRHQAYLQTWYHEDYHFVHHIQLV